MALGFEQAGFDVVAALEIDPAHAAVHKFNFPSCPVVEEDATTVAGRRLLMAARQGLRSLGRDDEANSATLKIDVVFGGPPCQGFSVGGLLDPEDPRNKLVGEFARLVDEIAPKAFVLENVPAMGSRTVPGEELLVPEWLDRELAWAGYDVAAPVVLNASRFGVPQDRRRLVVVGVRRPRKPPAAPKPTTAAVLKTPGRRARYWEVGHPDCAHLPAGPTVGDALGDLVDLDDRFRSSDSARLTRAELDRVDCQASTYAKILRGDARDVRDFSRLRIWDPTMLTSSLRTAHHPDVVRRFEDTPQGDREPTSRYPRLHRDGISGTLRAGSTPDRGSFSAPRPIHYEHDRVISVREAARLHGYPDWFRFSAAKWHGFRQVGNSVCPPLARAVAETVRESLRLPATRVETPVPLGDEALLRVPSGAGRVPKPRRHAVAAA